MAEATCAEKLSEARVALHALLTGKSVAVVGYGDRRVQYTMANIDQLRSYIRQLEAECGDPALIRRPIRGIF